MVRDKFGLCSERAIASVTPAIPAPMIAILRGGGDRVESIFESCGELVEGLQ